MKTPSPPPPPAEMSFEDALLELENIVDKMRDESLPLESLILAHHRGVLLSRHCEAQLNTAEEKIQIIENGKIEVVDRSTLEKSV